MTIERFSWVRLGITVGLALGLTVGLTACGASDRHSDDHDHDHGHDHGSEESGRSSWAITAWGESFEIFPEVENLVVGETSKAHIHLTRLSDFSPPAEGTVELVLRSASGEQVFGADAPVRPGVFDVEVRPESAGDFDLSFRIGLPGLAEEIRGGRVRVGAADRAGGLLVAPAPKGGSGGEPLDFSKEEQWRGDFATSWVRRGRLAVGVEGLARLRPPAGGEVVLSSPVDGIVRGVDEWPFAGRSARRGETLFRVVPRVAAERSLASLEAEATALDIEHKALAERLARLEELLALDAIGLRQVEEVRHEVEVLATRHSAAVRDLDAAAGSRRGGAVDALDLRAPFAGTIAEVTATPGMPVAAGEPLGRLVRTDRIWLEMALSPSEASRIRPGEIGGVVLYGADRQALRLEDDIRLMAVAPEASAGTGKVSVLLDAPAGSGLILGTTLAGRVLLRESRAGIVIPSTALVDDGGVSVVYLQLSGESFLRQEVDVLEREGDRVLVGGLEPGQRLVHLGGGSIRRSSLMSSGEAHGHVH